MAAELRKRVELGEITGILPGVRLLSKVLGVSVPTLCRALHLLEAEGVLTDGGNRRRWRVNGNHPASGVPGQDAAMGSSRQASVEPRCPGRLLFLASQPLSKERHSGVEVFSELLDQMGTTGWEVMYRLENFWTAKNPRGAWQRLLELTMPTAVVALGGTPVLGSWLRDQRVRALFLGGDAGDSGVPVVAVRVTTMLQDALDRLAARGHHRILLPLCGRAHGLVARCRECLAAHKMGNRITIAETPYARPEVLVALLRRHWRKQAPDALIFFDWREFMAASGFFREADLMVPRDVSVVVLSQNATMDWHVPAITHFEHPVNLMARTVSKWVIGQDLPHSAVPMFEVRARWVEGASVAVRAP